MSIQSLRLSKFLQVRKCFKCLSILKAQLWTEDLIRGFNISDNIINWLPVIFNCHRKIIFLEKGTAAAQS